MTNSQKKKFGRGGPENIYLFRNKILSISSKSKQISQTYENKNKCSLLIILNILSIQFICFMCFCIVCRSVTFFIHIIFQINSNNYYQLCHFYFKYMLNIHAKCGSNPIAKLSVICFVFIFSFKHYHNLVNKLYHNNYFLKTVH